MQNKQESVLAKISSYFIHNYRITILLTLFILGFGYFTYSSLLVREGFPSIDVPIVSVQTPYLVNDPVRVDTEVASPILETLNEFEGIKSVTSYSSENASSIIIELEETIEVDAAKKELRPLLKDAALPSGAHPLLISFDASKFNGEYDMLVSIGGTVSSSELLKTTESVAAELSALQEVAEAKVISTFENIPNSDQTLQTSFNRIGINEDGELNFYTGLSIGINKNGSEIDITELSNNVRSALESNSLLDDYKVVYTGDFAEVLNSQIKSLEENAVFAIITIFVILFFFINWRSAVVLGLFIPITLGAVFISLYLIGYTLNTISLFSLILVLGLFVDDGTIVVEAIDYYKKRGFKGIAAVKAAISDIGVADISGTLTTILVFLPLIFVSGVLGEFIRLLPITVILALAISLVIALTIIPKLSNVLIRDEKSGNKHGRIYSLFNLIFYGFTTLLSRVGEKLALLVSWYLKSIYRSLLVIIIVIAIIIWGGSFAGKLGFSIFPAATDSNQISVALSFPENVSLAEAENLTTKLENKLSKNYANVITQVDYLAANNRNIQMELELTDYTERDETSVQIAKNIDLDIAAIAGLSGRATSQGVGPGTQEFPFAVQIFGEDDAALNTIAKDMTSFMKNTALSDGITVTETSINGFNTINKVDNKRYIEVKAKFSAEGSTGLINELQLLVEKEYTPEKLVGFGLDQEALGFDFGQESENQESFSSTIFAALAALFIMYALLVVQFNSFLQPILVLFAVPMSFPGLFAGLFYTDNPFSFFVMIGITGLIGIVVNNTIMLIEYANNHKESLDYKAAIVEALKLRFRPIVTTSITTIAGLLPLALTDPFWEPLAFTIIFGLISSTTLVILTFPAFYVLIEKVRDSKYKVLPFLKEMDSTAKV